MNILVLTDHKGHTVNNSVYRIVQEVAKHQAQATVSVASRSDDRNTDFFSNQSTDIFAASVDSNFSYESAQIAFDSAVATSLDQYDIIFLRLPRPIGDGFFSFLKNNFDENRIVNRPSGIENTSNKSFLTKLDKYVVPMALCEDFAQIQAFVDKYDCVLKPLEEYGGKGIIKIQNARVQLDDMDMSMAEFAAYYKQNKMPYLAMKFLKNVQNGDKRIVVVNGHILASSLRMPGPGQWLCNVAQGGTDVPTEPTAREIEMVKYLNPILLREGIFYYGLDTLEDDNGDRVISEVNTLSIGGIAPAEKRDGMQLSGIFADEFISYCKNITQ